MDLPLDSKIWIFQSFRDFTGEEIIYIENTFKAFMKEWNAHGAALTSAYAIPYDRFLVVAVDENQATASGCSIDSMTRIIKALEDKLQVGLLNRMLVSYKLGELIHTISLKEFKDLVKEGKLPEDTMVFHNGLTNLEDFYENWELPLHESWAKNLMNSTSV